MHSILFHQLQLRVLALARVSVYLTILAGLSRVGGEAAAAPSQTALGVVQLA